MFNVLLLCEYATLNGGEQSMLSTLDGMREAGITPCVLGPSEGPLAAALRARNIELLPFASHDASGTRLSQQQRRDQLDRILRNRRPDVLHANSLAMGRLSGPVARALQLPSLAHLRDIIGISRQALADLN
ncbi:MAG TPA: glycosyltransferase, partial [Thermoguttaceae bacterium]|nr:glycosyltransferase [Thermoguttaceae bacterium]